MSHEAAVAAAAMGYTNPKIYQAGIPDWVRRGLPVERGAAPARR